MTQTGTVALTVRLPRALHRELTHLARAEYSSVNSQVTQAVQARVDAAKKRGKP